jgi:serine/threonine-protein kinase
MNDDPKSMSIHGEEDDVMEGGPNELESFRRFLVDAMTGFVSPSTDRIDADVAALTEAEGKALAALGTPEEVVRRIVARLKDRPPLLSLSGSDDTRMLGASTLDTPHDPRDGRPAGPDFEELLDRYSACRRLQQISWSCQYRKVRQIGRGGQGVVYLIECQDTFFGKRALKIFSPKPYGSWAAYLDDMQGMARVASEVHKKCHENLLQVERFEAHDGIYMMVMRLIDGYDLQRLVTKKVVDHFVSVVDAERWAELKKIVYAPYGAEQWALAPGPAVNIIEKCLRGVYVLHAKGIVHCDIKPSNIMVDSEGGIRLIDIGSAIQLDSPPRRPSWTPRYAPPEVLAGGAWTPQGDLASLGYVLIELLSGRPDLLGPDAAAASVHDLDRKTRIALANEKRSLPDRLEKLYPLRAWESKCLITLIKTLIDPVPAKRFSSAEQAFDWTVKFRDELARAQMAMPWVKVMKYWITDAQKAIASIDSCD